MQDAFALASKYCPPHPSRNCLHTLCSLIEVGTRATCDFGFPVNGQSALTHPEGLVIVSRGFRGSFSPGTLTFVAVETFWLLSAGTGNRTRMNLPILLTLLRIFFVPLLVVLLLTKGANMDLWAVGVFLLAAVTDLLDGYLARKHSQVTTLGILLDPLADKLLTSAAFIALVELQLVPAWMVVIIVGRELAVTGLRAIASARGWALEASDLGKTKMVLQVTAITVIVLEQRLPAIILLGDLLLWLVVVFALASAAQYLWVFWKVIDIRFKRRAPGSLKVLRVNEKGPEEKNAAAHGS